MSKYKPGFVDVMVDGKKVKRYRDADGKYYREEPGFGRQTIEETFSGSGPAGLFGSMGGWSNRRVYGDMGQEQAARIQARYDSKKSEIKTRKSGMSNLDKDYAKEELELGEQAEKFRPGAGFPGQQQTATETPLSGGGGDASGGGGDASGPAVNPQDALKAFLGKLDTKYGITYGDSKKSSNSPDGVPDTSTGEYVSITNGPNAGKYLKTDDENFDAILSGEMKGETTGVDGIGSKKLADALSDKESLRYNPREGAYEGGGSAKDYVPPGLDPSTRAFMDYNGPGGTLMALRARDAARNTLRAGGRDYQIDGDSKATLISREGSEYLRDNSNADAASEEFITNFMKPKVAPSDNESSDVTDPLPATRADYMSIGEQQPMAQPFNPNESIPSIDRGDNRSLITGNALESYMTNSSNAFDPTAGEPPVNGFLPDTKYWDDVRKLIY